MLTPPELKGGRTHLTIMFVDLCDSSLIASQLEPELYSELLERLRKEILRASKIRQGEIIRIDGDGFILTFGRSKQAENGPKQAIETALDIRKCIEQINTDYSHIQQTLRLRTAIHSGVVLIKKGDLKKGTYEILGDPTNTTSHLCRTLSPADIVITDEALGRTKDLFNVTPKRTVFLEKLQKSITIRSVLDVKRNISHSLNNATYHTQFIGRDYAYNWLENFINAGIDNSHVAMVLGEAGLGKSRLVSEFFKIIKSDKYEIHQCICESYLGSKPLKPIEQLAQSVKCLAVDLSNRREADIFAKSIESLDEILVVLEAFKTPLDVSYQTIEQLAIAISQYCIESQQDRICLFIDDWQWIDSASKTVIEKLIEICPHNLKIILASRNTDEVFSAMNKVDVLRLKPLTKNEIHDVATTLVPGIEPFTLMRIKQYSGGNPLYLEELCHAINDSRFQFENKNNISWLESLIYTRFSQLSAPLAHIVETASVIGHVIPHWLLQETTQVPITESVLLALRDADFLYPSETKNYLRFKHGITKDVIYKMIGLKERVEIHKQIIKQIIRKSSQFKEELPHEELAYHYSQSGNFLQSIESSKIAGNKALKSFSLDKAQAHFKNALTLDAGYKLDNAERLDLLNKYGRSCVVDPSHDQLDLLKKLLSSSMNTSDKKLRVWSEYWLGFILYGLGYPIRSVKHFEKCDKLAHKLKQDKLVIQLKANLGQAYAAACQYDKAYKLLDEAIDLKFRHRSGQYASPGLAYAISCKGFALGEQGHLHEAEECFEKASTALSGKEHVANTSILNQRAVVNLWHGNTDICLALTQQTHEMSRHMHSRYNYAQSVFLSAAAKFKQTLGDEEISRMIEATQWLVYDGIGQNLSLNYGGIVEALAIKKEWKKLRLYAAKGLRRSRLGDKRCESQILRGLALAAKAGETKHSADYYMHLSGLSAKDRKSNREIQNNEIFKEKILGMT